MKDESKKHVIINEFFDRGIWRLIWKTPVLSVYAGARDAVICVLSVIATRDRPKPAVSAKEIALRGLNA